MIGADIIMTLFIMMQITLLIVKLLNVMELGKFYDRKWIFITLILSALSYLFIIVTTMAYHTILYIMYLNIITWIFMINFILTVGEVFTIFRSLPGVREPMRGRRR